MALALFDKDIDTAKMPNRTGDDVLDAVFEPDVTLDGKGLAATGSDDLLRGRIYCPFQLGVRLSRFPPTMAILAPSFAKPESYRLPNTPGAPCDEHCLIL